MSGTHESALRAIGKNQGRGLLLLGKRGDQTMAYAISQSTAEEIKDSIEIPLIEILGDYLTPLKEVNNRLFENFYFSASPITNGMYTTLLNRLLADDCLKIKRMRYDDSPIHNPLSFGMIKWLLEVSPRLVKDEFGRKYDLPILVIPEYFDEERRYSKHDIIWDGRRFSYNGSPNSPCGIITQNGAMFFSKLLALDLPTAEEWDCCIFSLKLGLTNRRPDEMDLSFKEYLNQQKGIIKLYPIIGADKIFVYKNGKNDIREGQNFRVNEDLFEWTKTRKQFPQIEGLKARDLDTYVAKCLFETEGRVEIREAIAHSMITTGLYGNNGFRCIHRVE